jgi:tripartite-type tricarboxylate transporter receptor subunit TctC
MTVRQAISRRSVLAGLAGFAATSVPSWSRAAETPGIARLVVGSGPGSVIDTLARRVAEKLQPGYAATVLVENKTGASGHLAVGSVKTAPADGLTLLLAPTPYMAIYPHTYRKLAYKPDSDFAAVSLAATLNLGFAVGPAVPAEVQSLKAFAAWCRDNPSKAHFGSPAAGSTPHFAGVMLARAGHFTLEHVPYRGPTPAVLEMVGGQIAAACVPLGDLQSFVSSGKCRLLGTSGARRSRFAPGTPTFAEQGFGDVVIDDWFGFFLPAATPPAQVARASTAIQAILARPDLQQAMEPGCVEVRGSAPEALAQLLKADTARWAPVVKSIGFTADS